MILILLLLATITSATSAYASFVTDGNTVIAPCLPANNPCTTGQQCYINASTAPFGAVCMACPAAATSRIVGGTIKAPFTEYFATIHFRNNALLPFEECSSPALSKPDGQTNCCGGTLIDENTVVSAAHCIEALSGGFRPPGQIGISLGSYFTNRSLNTCAAYYDVIQMWVHPKYTRANNPPSNADNANDIVFYQLNRTVNNFKPIPFDNGAHDQLNTNVTVLGIGFTYPELDFGVGASGCTVDPGNRTDCAAGQQLTKEQCESRACCYDSSSPLAPACFYPQTFGINAQKWNCFIPNDGDNNGAQMIGTVLTTVALTPITAPLSEQQLIPVIRQCQVECALYSGCNGVQFNLSSGTCALYPRAATLEFTAIQNIYATTLDFCPVFTYTPTIPTRLKQAEVEILDCPPDSRFPGKICAGRDFGGVDACRGDSGGPLVYIDKASGREVLVGIVSNAPGGFCGTRTVPGVYTQVSHYQNFLKAFKDNTKSCNKPADCSATTECNLNYNVCFPGLWGPADVCVSECCSPGRCENPKFAELCVCKFDPACCNGSKPFPWDEQCMDEAKSRCGLTC